MAMTSRRVENYGEDQDGCRFFLKRDNNRVCFFNKQNITNFSFQVNGLHGFNTIKAITLIGVNRKLTYSQRSIIKASINLTEFSINFLVRNFFPSEMDCRSFKM